MIPGDTEYFLLLWVSSGPPFSKADFLLFSVVRKGSFCEEPAVVNWRKIFSSDHTSCLMSIPEGLPLTLRNANRLPAKNNKINKNNKNNKNNKINNRL